MFPARRMRAFSSPSTTQDDGECGPHARRRQIGLTQQNVAQSLLVALSGSFQTTPSFYLDPRNGVTYNVAMQAPQYGSTRWPRLRACPLPGSASGASMLPPATATRRAPRRLPGATAGRGAGQSGQRRARHRTGHGEPLRHPAGDRHLRQRGRDRPGHRHARDGKDRCTATRRNCRAARTSFCAARARR